MKNKDILSSIVFGIPALFFLCVGLMGCDYQSVPVKNYASTNSPPSRFQVVSSDFYHMGNMTPDLTLTVFSDT
jgi:hypothetical protein